MNKSSTQALSLIEQKELLAVLQARFESNMQRHADVKWAQVEAALTARSDALWSLHEMERTGGGPDMVEFDTKTGEYVFYDCSPETPFGRRSLCYDRAGWEARKEHRPVGTAIEIAATMGIELLTVEQYEKLQTLGDFDTKTSSWLLTPAPIRALGGALFADRRYDTVFVYHNGASSYYAVRGFRGALRVS